jgi:hypothetical protein
MGSVQGPPPAILRIPNAPPGAYVGKITGVALDTAEPWSVSFATNPPCSTTKATDYPPIGPVRLAVSDQDINTALATSNIQNAAVSISPTAGGAIISAHLSANGTSLAGTAVVYAAPPNLGISLASASVNGINVTSQVAQQLAKAGGRSLSSIDMGFSIDRVYGCKGPQGGLMVIEGHR